MAIAGGGAHSLALKDDGTLWAWGYNGNGQLGDGTLTGRTVPVPVSGLTGITAIAAGGEHSLALQNNGTLWAWGMNAYGQLGDGTTEERHLPQQVPIPAGASILALSARGDFSLAVAGTPLDVTAEATPSSGWAPLAVAFHGQATGGDGIYTWAWDFGDGGTSAEQNPAHTYTTAGTYTWTLTVTSGGMTGSQTGTVTVCALQCSATVPAKGQTGTAVPFQGSAAISGGCSASVSYAWNFGDGAASSEQNPTHTYASAGTYTWTLTVTAGGTTCTQTGTVVLVNPPVISAMTKLVPFAIKVTGSNFQPGIQVFIGTGTTPWSSVRYKNTAKIVIQGGQSLKNLFPKGQPVTITLVNPDGGFATGTFIR
jgi:hypothetical protein